MLNERAGRGGSVSQPAPTPHTATPGEVRSPSGNGSSEHHAELIAGRRWHGTCPGCDADFDVKWTGEEFWVGSFSTRCPGRAECLRLLADAAGAAPHEIKSDPLTHLAPWLNGRSRRAGGEWEPGPSETTVRLYHDNLLVNASVLRYLIEKRGVPLAYISRYELGYDEPHNAVTFPIRDAAGELVNLKRRFLDPGASPKCSGMRGEGRSHLYPVARLHGPGPLVLCEGEFTALVLDRFGFRAVTSTASKSWKPEWTEQLAGQQVAVLYDVDAEEHAERRAAELRAEGVDAWAARLSRAGFKGKTDPDDVLVQYGWSADELRRLIRKPRTQRRFLRERRSA